jgi:hypothetical protein
LSCFTRDGFCTMAPSSGSKKSTQSNSDSDSDTEQHRARRMNGLARCLIIVMTCLERPRKWEKSLGLHSRTLGLEWLS